MLAATALAAVPRGVPSRPLPQPILILYYIILNYIIIRQSNGPVAALAV
jgi:hypothetical protein